MESTSFAERLDNSFTSLIQPYRYTGYDISSFLQPTTMLFGCPLPDDLDGASVGQRAVNKAFETILSSAAKMHPNSLYQAICDAHKQEGSDIKLVRYLKVPLYAMLAHVTVAQSALQLESLWDLSQPDGGLGARGYLARAPSAGLLVVSLRPCMLCGTTNHLVVFLEASSRATSATSRIRYQKGC